MWRQNLNVGNGFLEGLEDVFVEDAAAADAEKKKKKDKNGLSLNEIRTHLLKNTTKFWLMIPAFYHFTFLSLQPTKQSRQKQAFCVFLKFCQIEKKFLKLQHRTQKAIFLPEQKDWLLKL